MYLRRRIAHRQRLCRRREDRAGSRRGLSRINGRRQRGWWLHRRFWRRRSRRRWQRCECRLRLRRNHGRAGIGRTLSLRCPLASRPVAGIKAGIAGAKAGRAAIDGRRADTAWRRECPGRRCLSRRSGRLPWTAKAWRIVWIAVERRLQEGDAGIENRRLRCTRCRRQRRGYRDRACGDHQG